MHTDLINIGLAFFEGFALIISPCILPILPIILSGSLAGNKARPIGIIVSFVITFTIVTLFSRAIIQHTHVSQDSIRNVSFILLLLFGIVIFSSYLTDKFNLLTQRLSNVGSTIKTANNPQSGFFGGMIFGGLVGIIWTPCAGPILAAVIVQVIIQKTTYNSILIVIAFAIGAGLPMLLIAFLGRELMAKFTFFRNNAALLRKILGLIIIASVIFLIYDSNISYSTRQITNPSSNSSLTLINGLEHPYKAPEIAGIDAWINSPPLHISDLKGKVVLIDFWTYTCINCIRSLPYVKNWYDKYHDKGLEIIGIHSPEFQFEHDLSNVKNAVIKYGITYPVALDNNFTTWQNYNNQYWPAHYLINKDGDVVYEHFGEGEYDVTENNIRYLLGLNGPEAANKSEENYPSLQTPETYLGYARAERFNSPESVVQDKPGTYTQPTSLPEHGWALSGKWNISADKITAAEAGAKLKLRFRSKKVFAVMGAAEGKPVSVKILLNGKPVVGEKGEDVLNGQVLVKGNQLYSLINLKSEGSGVLELMADGPGLEVYTFTFG